MRFSDLGRYDDLSAFSTRKFYSEDIGDKTPMKVMLAMKMMPEDVADDAFVRLLNAADKALLDGHLMSLAEVMPKAIPKGKLLAEMMRRFSHSERCAIMVSFCEGMPLSDVVRLKRSEMMARKWQSSTAKYLKQSVPRLGAPWVFWRNRAGVAIPLLDLPVRWAELMPMPFAEFCDSYRRYGHHYA